MSKAQRLYDLLIARAGREHRLVPLPYRRAPRVLLATTLQAEIGDYAAQCAAFQALRKVGRIIWANPDYWRPNCTAARRVLVGITDLGLNHVLRPRVSAEMHPPAVEKAAAVALQPATATAAPVNVRRTVAGERFLACLREVRDLGGDPGEVQVADAVPDLLRHRLIFNACSADDLAALMTRARTQQRCIDEVLADVIAAGLVVTNQEGVSG